MSFQNAAIVKVNADPVVYHTSEADRGALKFVVSSGALREFGRCPSRWKAGYESPDSDSKRFGSLLDCLLLTPERFKDAFAVVPATYPAPKTHTKVKLGELAEGDPLPWNANANHCYEWQEARESLGLQLVRDREFDEAQAAVMRFLDDEIIKSFLSASDRQVWVQGEWLDESGLVVPVKALLDLVPRVGTEFAECLGDLKTTRNASILPWQRWCFQAGYHIQAALYTDLYVAATGEDRNSFCFLLQENFAPWQPAKRLLSQDFLTFGRSEVARMLGNYCACLKANKWPGYDDTDEAVQGWSLVQPEPFMQERAMFAPKFDFENEEDAVPVGQGDDLRLGSGLL